MTACPIYFSRSLLTNEPQTVPQKYATRVCNLIGMLGLRGISVLESSGDTGMSDLDAIISFHVPLSQPSAPSRDAFMYY